MEILVTDISIQAHDIAGRTRKSYKYLQTSIIIGSNNNNTSNFLRHHGEQEKEILKKMQS